MDRVHVQDAQGRPLSPCSRAKAERLVASGQAVWTRDDPPTVRLRREVALPEPAPATHPLHGKRVLLHVCCGPCATYTLQHLQAAGAQVTAYWYNPNIHPYGEHELRRDALRSYAQQTGLAVIWEPGYDLTAFLQAICGHEQHGERCAICYRMRLERAARAAAEGGFDAFTTTLLISPYQDLETIAHIGRALEEVWDVPFHGENLRRGFAEHHRLAREYGLYQQRYCGCIYSEWEARDPQAPTRRRAPAKTDPA